MNQNTQKQQKVLIFTALLALLCLLMLSLSTWAWLASNRSADVGGVTIRLEDASDSISKVSCYPVTQINGSTYTYAIVDNFDFSLPIEDPANIITSQYKKANIIHFSCTIPDGVTNTLYVRCFEPWLSNTGLPDHTDKNIAEKHNHMSNCIQLSTISASNPTAKTVVLDQTFFFVDSIATAATNKRMEIELGEYDSSTTDIYIILEYKPDLVLYYSQDTDITYQSVFFENDLLFELRSEEP